MAAAAGADAHPEVRLEQVEWLVPVVVGAGGLELHVELFDEADGKTGYEICSGVAAGADEARVIHSQGWAVVERGGAVAEVCDVPCGTLLVKRAWQARPAEPEAVPADRQHWIVLCGGEAWAGQVEAEIISALPQARCVVAGGGAEDVAQRYHAAVLQVLEVLQRIVQDKPKHDVLIQAVVGVSGEAGLFGGLCGLLQTARQEQPRLKGQVIAVEAQESAASIARYLQDSAGVPDEREVRYVGGERQVASWCELAAELEQPHSLAEVPWRDGGVYLISGGGGGLGLIFAGEIARRVKDAVVVLTGRSELDEGRRAQLAALQRSGSRIEYRRVDVADSAAVSSLIGELRQAYGSVNGILHAAGIIRDSVAAVRPSPKRAAPSSSAPPSASAFPRPDPARW